MKYDELPKAIIPKVKQVKDSGSLNYQFCLSISPVTDWLFWY